MRQACGSFQCSSVDGRACLLELFSCSVNGDSLTFQTPHRGVMELMTTRHET
jgi:hypothetical protein